MELTHFSTFTGIAGFDLAAKWAGFRTIGMVEKNPYRREVLRKYWPDVPLWEDIRDVTKENVAHTYNWGQQGDLGQTVPERSHQETPHTEFSGRGQAGYSISKTGGGQEYEGIPPVTLVTGGFPCQSFSVAGKRKGKADDRYLWPEMLRVIKLLRPHWVLAENVTGIVKLALDTVLSDLESEGYSTQAFNIPACAVNAPHRRERIWIVGYSECNGYEKRHSEARGKIGKSEQGGICKSERTSNVADPQFAEVRNGGTAGGASDKGGRITRAGGEALRPGQEASQPSDTGQGGEALAHPKSREPGEQKARNWGQGSKRGSQATPDSEKQPQREQTDQEDTIAGDRESWQEPSSGDWWEFEPDVGRVAHGVPSRVDRLSALGDAIVPQVAYEIIKNIAEIEKAIKYSQ